MILKSFSIAALFALTSLPGRAATVVHYDFDGNALDSSGAGNHGLVVGSPTFVAGEFDGAIAFDNPIGATNATQYVKIPSSSSIGALSDLSFSVTMKFKSTDTSQLNGRLFGNGGSSANGLIVINYNDVDTAEATAAIRGSTGTLLLFELEARGNPDALVTDGDWHWVTLTLDRVGSVAQYFVDEVLIDSQSFTNLGSVSLNDLSLGAVFFTPQFSARATVVDDFRMFDIPLSAAQVENLVTTGTVPLPPAFICLVSALFGLGVTRRRG